MRAVADADVMNRIQDALGGDGQQRENFHTPSNYASDSMLNRSCMATDEYETDNCNSPVVRLFRMPAT